MNNIFITTVRTPVLGDGGLLLPDKDGFYTSVVGGLNIPNSSGDFYVYNSKVAKLFEDAGALNRRAFNQRLRGEVEHPDWPSSMTEDEYAARMLFIDSRNVCTHFAHFAVRPSATNRNADGTIVYDVVARYKPTGVNAKALETALANKFEDVCFSLRGFTYDEFVGGTKIRILAEPITYDLVNDPGIATASANFNPAQKIAVARECHQAGRALTETGMRRALDKMHRANPSFARECAFVNTDTLFRTFGWKTPTELGFANWS